MPWFTETPPEDDDDEATEMSQTAVIRRHTADGESSSTESPGGLRQYHRPAVVQVATIIGVIIGEASELDTVRIRGHDGGEALVTCPGMFQNGTPLIGDCLLLWPHGKTEWVSAEEFAQEWAPVEGPVLL